MGVCVCQWSLKTSAETTEISCPITYTEVINVAMQSLKFNLTVPSLDYIQSGKADSFSSLDKGENLADKQFGFCTCIRIGVHSLKRPQSVNSVKHAP